MVRDRKIAPRKIAPRKIAPQQIPPWFRIGVWVMVSLGGGGAIFRGAIFRVPISFLSKYVLLRT